MNPRIFLIIILQLLMIQAVCSRAAQSTSSCLPDSIDIILLEEANHIWDAFGMNIWQFYNPDSLPILLYQSSDQHWLLNHPNPPVKFQKANFLNYSVSIKTPDSRKKALSDIAEKSELAKLCFQEQYALYQAHIEKDADKSRSAILEFLTFRNQRTKLMNEKEIQIEDYMELLEGTAQYIEFRLSEYVQNGFKSLQAMSEHQEFHNYKNVSISPALSIQNAETGILTSSRVYTTGTLMCLLLDRYASQDWKKDVFKNYHNNKTSLCLLLSNCIYDGGHNKSPKKR